MVHDVTYNSFAVDRFYFISNVDTETAVLAVIGLLFLAYLFREFGAAVHYGLDGLFGFLANWARNRRDFKATFGTFHLYHPALLEDATTIVRHSRLAIRSSFLTAPSVRQMDTENRKTVFKGRMRKHGSVSIAILNAPSKDHLPRILFFQPMMQRHADNGRITAGYMIALNFKNSPCSVPIVLSENDVSTAQLEALFPTITHHMMADEQIQSIDDLLKDTDVPDAPEVFESLVNV